MWWYKLVVYWSKRDYIGFSLFMWVLIFCTITLLRMVQSRPLELSLMAILSLAFIPVELLIVVIFQRYSSHMDQIQNYPSLLQGNFDNKRLLESGKILVFFYAQWCPFSRSAIHLLSSLSPISYKVFKVDLSNEENPIWNSLKIRRIPTLIAFDGGKEFFRREATYMIGLRRTDFNDADLTMQANVAE